MRRDSAAFCVFRGLLRKLHTSKVANFFASRILRTPATKRRNVSHFGVSVPRKNASRRHLKASAERGRDRGEGVSEVRRVSMARIWARVAAREGPARLRGGSASACASRESAMRQAATRANLVVLGLVARVVFFGASAQDFDDERRIRDRQRIHGIDLTRPADDCHIGVSSPTGGRTNPQIGIVRMARAAEELRA